MPQSGNVTPVRYDLIQYARVTQVISNTVFISDDLAGFLSDTFIGYSVWVLTKTDGTITAPRGEDPKLISIFEGNGTGQVTHAAFTANLAVGDEVLILHPSVANATTMAALIGTIITSLVNLPDGVYLDTISGFAGTAWPIGSPGRPALTLADALTIAAARNLSKLYLVGDGAHTLTLTNGFSMRIEGNPEYAITIPALATVLIESDLVCDQLTNNGDIQIDGTLTTGLLDNLGAGGIYIDGDTEATAITNSAGGDITVIGKLTCKGGFDNTGGDDIGVTGDVFISGTLTLTGASDLLVYGNIRANGLTSTSTGVININGALIVEGNITINAAGATFTVDNTCYAAGTLTIGNTATVTIYGNTFIYDVAHAGSGLLFIGGNLEIPTGIISNGGGAITVNGNVSLGTNLNNTGGGNLTVTGDVKMGGTLTNTTAAVAINGNTQIGEDLTLSGAGIIIIDGYCFVGDDITFSSSGSLQLWGLLTADSITGSANNIPNAFWGGVRTKGNISTGGSTGDWYIYGKSFIGGTLIISSSGNIIAEDDFSVASSITLSGQGDLSVSGNLRCDTIAMSNSSAQLTVYGDIRCTSITCTAGIQILADNFFCAGVADFTAVSTINIYGDADVQGTITNTTGQLRIYGNVICTMLRTTNGDVFVNGNIQTNAYSNADLRTTGTGAINIFGNAQIGNNVLISNTGNIIVTGNIQVGLNVTLSNTGDLTVNGNLKVNGTITMGNTGEVLTVTGDITCNAFTSTANGGISCYNFFCAGAADFTTTGGPTITINGKCEVGGNLTNTTGAMTVDLDLQTSGNISTTTGSITVNGNAHVKGTTTASGAAGAITIYGNATLIGAVGATDAAASITIYGIADIYGAITATGTVTYKGKHPEVAVSFNATDVAAEFFHLAAATGTQYDVSKVRIKCADPGAQTVTVTLEEYVNGALTAVDTFAITTANYTNYFSLMDMFGVDHLSGDELRISAVASDAGPYAVTGSYVYSNR